MTPKTTPDPAKRIPAFATRQEEADFWDTHDTTDYASEFTPVHVRFAKNLSTGITIRFSPDTLEKLRVQAHERGVGPTTLARMWVLEHLRDSKAG